MKVWERIGRWALGEGGEGLSDARLYVCAICRKNPVEDGALCKTCAAGFSRPPHLGGTEASHD